MTAFCLALARSALVVQFSALGPRPSALVAPFSALGPRPSALFVGPRPSFMEFRCISHE